MNKVDIDNAKQSRIFANGIFVKFRHILMLVQFGECEMWKKANSGQRPDSGQGFAVIPSRQAAFSAKELRTIKNTNLFMQLNGL